MPWKFRILGPVTLARDGEVVPLGPPRRRAMLAALLLEANRPVPLPRLTAALWPGYPPRAAVANLRTHACALRRVLGGRLLTRPHAYQLQIEAAELDAAEFTRLASAGREALSGGQPATAIGQLAEALALWHGDAGDGLRCGTSLQARLVTLDQQRLDVFEDYAEACLHTGRCAEAAVDLRQHLAAYPVRERSWELLMLAQYRSGNVAGALAAYTDAYVALRDQLAVDPGPRLQKLHRAVLNRDPSLDRDPPLEEDAAGRGGTVAAPPRPAGDQVSRTSVPRPRQQQVSQGPAATDQPPTDPPPRNSSAPRQLPPRPALVIGRDAEWAALTAILRRHPDLVVVTGRAGAGKTTLAVRAAHATAGEFPDGQITLDLGGTDPNPRPPAELLATALLALGVPPDQLTRTAGGLAAQYRSWLAGRRVLALLDGAASAAQLRPLLTGDGATLLVTGRRQPAGLDRAQHLELPPLPADAATDVLTAYAGATPAARDQAGVRELVRLCDGLPLALRIAGERLAHRPELPAGLLARHLANRPLDGLRLGDLSVREALAADYLAVAAEDPLAADILPRLGRQEPDEPLTPQDLADELDDLGRDADASRVFFALELLVDAGLAESPQPDHYRVVGLPRAYATRLTTGQPAI